MIDLLDKIKALKPTQEELPELISTQDLAAIVSCTDSNIRKSLKTKNGPEHKMLVRVSKHQNRKMYDRDELIEWAKAQTWGSDLV